MKEAKDDGEASMCVYVKHKNMITRHNLVRFPNNLLTPDLPPVKRIKKFSSLAFFGEDKFEIQMENFIRSNICISITKENI